MKLLNSVVVLAFAVCLTLPVWANVPSTLEGSLAPREDAIILKATMPAWAPKFLIKNGILDQSLPEINKSNYFVDLGKIR